MLLAFVICVCLFFSIHVVTDRHVFQRPRMRQYTFMDDILQKLSQREIPRLYAHDSIVSFLFVRASHIYYTQEDDIFVFNVFSNTECASKPVPVSTLCFS